MSGEKASEPSTVEKVRSGSTCCSTTSSCSCSDSLDSSEEGSESGKLEHVFYKCLSIIKWVSNARAVVSAGSGLHK